MDVSVLSQHFNMFAGGLVFRGRILWLPAVQNKHQREVQERGKRECSQSGDCNLFFLRGLVSPLHQFQARVVILLFGIQQQNRQQLPNCLPDGELYGRHGTRGIPIDEFVQGNIVSYRNHGEGREHYSV